jgi:MFS family permease
MIGRRAGVLRERNFRRFFVGYTTSLLGTSMSAVAVAFAVLDSGGTAADLGYVFAAGIVPQVIFMLGGGVIADRFGRRRVMLAADAVRCCAQAALAAALFLGHPRIWAVTWRESVEPASAASAPVSSSTADAQA